MINIVDLNNREIVVVSGGFLKEITFVIYVASSAVFMVAFAVVVVLSVTSKFFLNGARERTRRILA